MTAYEITLKDQARERIDGADAYAQEGQLTTFFRTASARQVVDCWSVRLASFRTTEIMAVRRIEDPIALDHPLTVDDFTTAAGLRSA
jgi:hypothetical protein